jgi:hypothetical protein
LAAANTFAVAIAAGRQAAASRGRFAAQSPTIPLRSVSYEQDKCLPDGGFWSKKAEHLSLECSKAPISAVVDLRDSVAPRHALDIGNFA